MSLKLFCSTCGSTWKSPFDRVQPGDTKCPLCRAIAAAHCSVREATCARVASPHDVHTTSVFTTEPVKAAPHV